MDRMNDYAITIDLTILNYRKAKKYKEIVTKLDIEYLLLEGKTIRINTFDALAVFTALEAKSKTFNQTSNKSDSK
jgi:uncharacterized ubiquitin-like protein YukD